MRASAFYQSEHQFCLPRSKDDSELLGQAEPLIELGLAQHERTSWGALCATVSRGLAVWSYPGTMCV